MNFSDFHNHGNSRNHIGPAYNTYGDGAQHNSGFGQVINNNHRGRTLEREKEADKQVIEAARDGSTSRVRRLLRHQYAHAYDKDENGMTALHHACASDGDNVEMLEVLLEEGYANVNALNNAGESPLRLAINRYGASSATAKYLRNHEGKDLGPPPRQTPPARQPYRSPTTQLTGDQAARRQTIAEQLSARYGAAPIPESRVQLDMGAMWATVRQYDIEEGKVFTAASTGLQNRVSDRLSVWCKKKLSYEGELYVNVAK